MGQQDPEWAAYLFYGKGLDMLQAEANGQSVDWHGKDITRLLRQLMDQSAGWVLVFEWHCDQIDSVYNLPADEAVDLLTQNLRTANDHKIEGFVVLPLERKKGHA
jgi:hypothetical protein